MMYGDEKDDTLELDSATELGFCSWFSKLPSGKATENTLRLFSRGEFYSAHGDDALFVAAHIYRTNNVLKYLGNKRFKPAAGGQDVVGLPSVTLKNIAAINLMRDALTGRQMKVEIWEAEGGKKSAAKFNLTREVCIGRSMSVYSHELTHASQASPGNLQQVEDLLFSDSNDLTSSPIVISIRVASAAAQGAKTIGVAFADASLRELGVAQFVDNDLFSNTEVRSIYLCNAFSF